MIEFNQWMEKIGADKLLHFFVAAWCTSVCLLFGWIAGIVGAFMVVFFACVKETVLDDTADIWDVLWSCGGALASLAVGALCYFVF